MNFVLAINGVVGLLFFAYWIVVFVILYHLTRFGIGVVPKRLAMMCLLGSVALFGISVAFFVNLDLSTILK